MNITGVRIPIVGRQGCAGPGVDLDGVALSPEQRELCRGGLDERQLRMLKAQVREREGERERERASVRACECVRASV